MDQSKIWRHFDFALLGAVAVLVIIGTAMIRSTVLTTPDGGAFETGRQLLYVLVGVPIIFLVGAVDYRIWASVSGALVQ